jgi:hypothetical protein
MVFPMTHELAGARLANIIKQQSEETSQKGGGKKRKNDKRKG